MDEAVIRAAGREHQHGEHRDARGKEYPGKQAVHLPFRQPEFGDRRGKALQLPTAPREAASHLRAGLHVRARVATLVLVAVATGLFPPMRGFAEATRSVDIAIRDGRVVGKSSVRVIQGDTVQLPWRSDVRS
jgi:hypothetical protein